MRSAAGSDGLVRAQPAGPKSACRIIRWIALLLSGVLFIGPANAFTVYDAKGRPFLAFRELSPGEKPGSVEEAEFEGRPLSGEDVQSVVRGAQYFAELLGAPAKVPLIEIAGSTEKDANAAAESMVDPATGRTYLGGVFQGRVPGYPGGEAFIVIDFPEEGSRWAADYPLLPVNGINGDLPPIVMHELMHAFGLAVTVGSTADKQQVIFDEKSVYSAGLRDIFGTQAKTGMKIELMGLDAYRRHLNNHTRPDAGTFYYLSPNAGRPGGPGINSQGGVFFTGRHVQEVLAGAVVDLPDGTVLADAEGNLLTGLPGLPVNGAEGYQEAPDGNPNLPDYEFSHIELQNSLMSHQSWRNWTTLMEAEIALLQDLGYNIDRKRFYGHSLYRSGESGYVNSAGFSGDAAYGIGFHLYGHDNTVTQTGNIAAKGAYGAGIRMDGYNNNLTIAKGTAVVADGANSAGLLVSYGKNHVVNLDGALRATGASGIAARFDFGSNVLGDADQYRGSWLFGKGMDLLDKTDIGDIPAAEIRMPEALKGALVSEFNISGSLAGRRAAIYIANNAHVAAINVLPGATIEGDIVSDWDAIDAPCNMHYRDGDTIKPFPLTTALNFRPGGNTGGAMAYAGNIAGGRSIVMRVENGTLHYAGLAQVIKVQVDENATLSGGNYDVRQDPGASGEYGKFVNNGTFEAIHAGGGSAIAGNFEQNATGETRVAVNAAGKVNPLTVTGTARIEGAVSLLLQPDFYQNGEVWLSGAPVEAGMGLSGNFLFTAASGSPTLAASVSEDKNRLRIGRKPDAYSQFAGGSRADSVIGRALDTAWQDTDADGKALYRALDFSSPDGSGVRGAIHALSGPAYLDVTRSAFDMARLVDRTVETALEEKGTGRHLWTTPFGAWFSGKGSGSDYSARATGVAGGVTWGDSRNHAGYHVAAGYMNQSGSQGSHFEGEGLWLGGHVSHTLEPAGDLKWQGVGRIGVSTGRERRNVRFENYRRTGEARLNQYSLALSGKLARTFKTTGNLALKPFIGLNGTLFYVPSFSESSAGAARMAADKSWYRSLESRAGLTVSAPKAALKDPAYRWQWSAAVAYERELLDKAGTFRASLPGLHSEQFSRPVDWNDRNRCLLGGSLGIFHKEDFSFRLGAQAGLTNDHGSMVSGYAELQWIF